MNTRLPEQAAVTADDILTELIARYPQLKHLASEISTACSLIADAFTGGHKLLIAGNGGSAADSGHIAGELGKSFKFKRTLPKAEQERYDDLFGADGKALAAALECGLPAVALPDFTALNTAIINDLGGEYVFAQGVNALGQKGDVFLAISTSGNSQNLVSACMCAKVKGLCCIALTGKQPCRLDSLCEHVIHVPETKTFKVQELHLPVYHALCAMLEAIFFAQPGQSSGEGACIS
ncbi:MAG: SIS domain-containing protein [Succinivibrio sp.]|nr:SIS domain-containing protein [Succinivibrio sp.]